jgi:hypothetical protein
MLDNLRNQTAFTPEEEEPLPSSGQKPPKPPRPRRTFDQMTGMTAPQRFMLAVMLLITVCLLGSILLVFTQKVVLPFG